MLHKKLADEPDSTLDLPCDLDGRSRCLHLVECSFQNSHLRLLQVLVRFLVLCTVVSLCFARG